MIHIIGALISIAVGVGIFYVLYADNKRSYKWGYDKGYNSKHREIKRKAGDPIKGVNHE